MAIRYDKHDTKSATGEPVLAVTFFCACEGQRRALIARAQELPAPSAWVPFDPPEEPAWPSDRNASWYPPNCDGHNAEAVNPDNSAGAVLAQAQHEAAVDGEDCTSGACLLTRGSD